MKHGLFMIALLIVFNGTSQTTIKINLTLKDTSFYNFANYWGMCYEFIEKSNANYMTLIPEKGRVYDMGGGECYPGYELKQNLSNANFRIYVDSFLTETFAIKDNAIVGEHIRIRYVIIQKGIPCSSFNKRTQTYEDCNRRKNDFNVIIYKEELLPSEGVNESVRLIDKKTIRSLSREYWNKEMMSRSSFQKAKKQELAKKSHRRIIRELQLNP